MKHLDVSGVAAIGWSIIIDQLPPAARAAFDKERHRQVEQQRRLLQSHAKGEGGLTTYDPDSAGWIAGETMLLAVFAEYVAKGDLYARQRQFGVVEAARQVAG